MNASVLRDYGMKILKYGVAPVAIATQLFGCAGMIVVEHERRAPPPPGVQVVDPPIVVPPPVIINEYRQPTVYVPYAVPVYPVQPYYGQPGRRPHPHR